MGVFRFLDCLGENKLQLMEKKMGRSDYRESDSWWHFRIPLRIFPF